MKENVCRVDGLFKTSCIDEAGRKDHELKEEETRHLFQAQRCDANGSQGSMTRKPTNLVLT